MDPITHGLLGATAAVALVGRRHTRTALLAGLLGGMAPDLDVFIRSSDPLVGLVYHRHFTHSIFLAPFIGALAAAPLIAVPRFRSRARLILAAGAIGCFTHGILDALTSYGTLLFWPLTSQRISWDALPIVDLFFTPILLVGFLLAGFLRWHQAAAAALVMATVYTSAGFWMNARALNAQGMLAEARGHSIEARRAMPAPGTLVLWRSVYRHGGVIYTDDIRTPWLASTRAVEGGSVPHIVIQDLPEEIASDSRARRGFEIFAWFADDYTSWVGAPENLIIGDFRYGGSTNDPPLWGLQLHPGRDLPYSRWFNQGRGDYASSLWQRLTRGDPDMIPVREMISSPTFGIPTFSE